MNVFRIPDSVFEEFEILTKRDVEYSIWKVWVWKFEMLPDWPGYKSTHQMK